MTTAPVSICRIFALQMDRRDFHQEVLPVNHHMFAMRVLRVAFQPALEVKPGDQLCRV
jgi:hypothetical protein